MKNEFILTRTSSTSSQQIKIIVRYSNDSGFQIVKAENFGVRATVCKNVEFNSDN